jgi:REP element-mobilizing transposase RayT
LPIFRYRNYLPHLEAPNATYFVTFRLAGSIPKTKIEEWKAEKKEIIERAKLQKRPLSKYENERLDSFLSSKIEKYLDQLGEVRWLKEPAIAQLVVNALKYFDGIRYHLHAWCVMPNHVHVVFTTLSHGRKFDSDLIPILHSWKSFTAHEANKILRRNGSFWQDEYYDRLIRSDEEFSHYVEYTLNNPVQANLCKRWNDWPWSGCSEEIMRRLKE